MSITSEYLYDHVTPNVLMEDMSFSEEAPRPGERLPVFDLQEVDGGRIRSSDYKGRKPLLIIMGSLTCPMTYSSNPRLKELYNAYGARVGFVMLHVREAHPGEATRQTHTMQEKMEHARELQRRDHLPWPIAVDDLAGSVHQKFDKKPNAVFLADKTGTIIYRGLWAGDDRGLEQALAAAARGAWPEETESQRRLKPMSMGVGVMQELTSDSGPGAVRDLWRSAPPMAAMAWLASLYRPLPPQWRTAAAAATVGAAALLIGSAARRRRR
jgi:peroxiredoxin